MHLPLNIVLDLFSTFVLPIYHYGLPLWLSNCSASSLQSIDATLTKFLKRYFMVPLHSNNASIHFLSSTIPLSKTLKMAAPNASSSLTFPETLHGYRLSFLQSPCREMDHAQYLSEIREKIPPAFWLSRTLARIPVCPKYRRKLIREILDSDHPQLCQTNTFHPTPTSSCICTHCGEPASFYHSRFCTAFVN